MAYKSSEFFDLQNIFFFWVQYKTNRKLLKQHNKLRFCKAWKITHLCLLFNGLVGGFVSETCLAHFAYALADFTSPIKAGRR